MADLANLYHKRIAASTWKRSTQRSPRCPTKLSPEAAERFLSLLSQPACSANCCAGCTKRACWKKSFRHSPMPAACCNSTNITSTRSTSIACWRSSGRPSSPSDPGLLGTVYRGLKQKRTLHLALLIHDLGKGYVEDHSEVGLRIADDTAERLRLPPREAETLKFLVHKHLMMSHLAFRRDTSDDQLIVRFAVDVGSPEVLRDAVRADRGRSGGGRAGRVQPMESRSAGRSVSAHDAAPGRRLAVGRRRGAAGAVAASVARALDADPQWFDRQVAALPTSFLFSMTPERIAEQLAGLHELRRGEVHATGRYLSERSTVEYIVGTYEDITPGVFHKLTGGLCQPGLGNSLGRNQHAGRRPGARPLFRARSRLRRPAAARAA